MADGLEHPTGRHLPRLGHGWAAGVCRGLKGASQKRTLGREGAAMGVDRPGHVVLFGESKN